MQNNPTPEGRRRSRFGLRRYPPAIAGNCRGHRPSRLRLVEPQELERRSGSEQRRHAGRGVDNELARRQQHRRHGDAALTKWTAPVTSIGVTTPLKSTPPAGKTLVMLATSIPPTCCCRSRSRSWRRSCTGTTPR